MCHNLRDIPLKGIVALGDIRPEPFAERTLVVFKPLAIP
jgi:hypothetical protein